MNKLKKINKKDLLMKIMMVFIIIQPLLDIYLLFEDNVINFFHFSPSTIIRMFTVVFLGILTFLIFNKKRHIVWFISYIILIILYIICHHNTALQFKSNFPDNFNYSFINELFYVIRMMLPITVIYISSRIKYSSEKIYKILSWLVILISGSIVLTNFLGISLGTYNHKFTNITFFDWFNNKNYSFYYTATKGYFMYGNQVSALLLFLNTLLLYWIITKPNFKNIFLLSINFLAMFMLGTKVAAYGFLVIIISVILIYIFCYFINRKNKPTIKTLSTLIVFIILWALLFPISPANNRNTINTNIAKKHDYNIEDKLLTKAQKELNKINDSDDKEEYLKLFIKDNYSIFAISKKSVFEKYNYQYDPYFWYDIFQKDYSSRQNNRFIQKEILARMKVLNNNKLDNYFGLTYTRMYNTFPLEQDFISHFYTLGVVGFSLLLLPYIIVLILFGLYILNNFKKECTLINLIICLSLSILIFAAFFSGNVMDSLFVSIIFAFFIGQYCTVFLDRKNKKTKVGIITWHHMDNYGSILQAYALKKTIEKLDCEVELINYRYAAKTNVIYKILRFIRGNMIYPNNCIEKRKKRFYKFRKEFLNETRIFSSNKQLKKHRFNYDVFICGSDQIWSPNRFDSSYYIDFVNNKVKIAYAPSVVIDSYTEEQKRIIKQCLLDFKAISLREEKGAKIIEDITGIKYPTVLDPTLLLTQKDYDKIGKMPKIREKYILCLLIGDDDKYEKSVTAFANDKSLKIKNLVMSNHHQYGDELIKDCGPKEFLGLIKNADYILTDSYHGMLLSIIYNKEFYVYKRFKDNQKANQNARIENVLKLLNINERFIDENVKISTKNKINYSEVNKELNKLRKFSIQFLKKNLN